MSAISSVSSTPDRTDYREVKAPSEPGTTVYWPTGSFMVALQSALKARGRYSGPDDGIGGPNTAKGIQLTAQAGGGYTGPIDGVFGPKTARAIQTYARDHGGYTGPIDGDPRQNSWIGFLKGLAKR